VRSLRRPRLRYRTGIHKCSSPRRSIPEKPIFHFIFGLPWLLVVTRFLWPLHLPLAAKFVVALLLLVASQFHFWSKLSSGSVLCPEFPRPVVVLFNWAFGGIILLALQQLLLDAATLVGGLIPGGSFSVQDGFRYAMAGLAACLAAIGVMQATRIPPLKDIEVRIQGLPRQFDGYTILQLTDLHISRLFPAAWARAVVERSNILGVDLIAITGDLIDGTLAVRRADVEPLRDLRATDGVYMIPGNHEYYFGYAAWMQHYASMGMVTLENRHVVFDRGGERLVLAGVTDRASRGGGFTAPNIEAAVEGSPDGAPVILLDHQPSEARRAAALGVKLQLSGHTHGGLVVGLDRLAARANGGYVSGRYQVGGMTLYVNNGTGLWPGFALRLGRPSELTRVTLREAAPSGL
jgi:predicted MPP superfamily phosphohydrolase